MGISNSGKNKRMGSNSSSIIVCTCHLLWLYPRVQTDNCLLPSRRMELPKSLMWLTSVCGGRVTVIHTNIFLDMINIIKLGHTPHGCCWVHRRGQAQGLLAVYVILLLYKSMKFILLRSDSQSGVIRIYDGRGSGTPLETIDKLHRLPVHVMAVCAIWYRIYEPHLTSSYYSTVIDTTQLYQRMRADLSNTGNRSNHSVCRRMSLACGRTRLRQTCTTLKRFVVNVPSPTTRMTVCLDKVNAYVHCVVTRLLGIRNILFAG